MFSRGISKAFKCTKHIRQISFVNDFHREYVNNVMKRCYLTTNNNQLEKLNTIKFRKDLRSLSDQFGNNSKEDGKLYMNNSEFVQVMHYLCSTEEYIQMLTGKPSTKILDITYNDIKKQPSGEWSIKNPDNNDTYLYLTSKGIKEIS